MSVVSVWFCPCNGGSHDDLSCDVETCGIRHLGVASTLLSGNHLKISTVILWHLSDNCTMINAIILQLPGIIQRCAGDMFIVVKV